MSHETVSVVIPLFNEEDNVIPLARALLAGLRDFSHPFEVIFVDDGSTDRTHEKLEEALRMMSGFASLVRLQRNFGQTAAMQAGMDHARGQILAILDGDLQNDPADIPLLVERLIREDLDLLSGWRRDRKDRFFSRRLPSWLANRLIGRMTGVHLNDYGCSLKVYRRDAIRGLRIYGQMHRFLPALVAMQTNVSRIEEQPVRHHPRRAGRSNYGLFRTYRVLLDLLSLFFFMRFRNRPAHFFGSIGLALAAPGGLILGYLLWVKAIGGEDIGGRPLLLVGILLVLMSAQFLSIGILGEIMVRIYYEATDTSPYVVASRGSLLAGSWKREGEPGAVAEPGVTAPRRQTPEPDRNPPPGYGSRRADRS